jgi:rare lipoprotein A
MSVAIIGLAVRRTVRDRKTTKTVVIGFAVVLQGCTLMPGYSPPTPEPSLPTPAPAAVKPKIAEFGHASWYGPGFHGKRTASGRQFDDKEFTAAHRTLPFGSKVRVINLDNEKSVTVEINDRGPRVDGRIIDLSRAAASALGMVENGLARVRIEVLALP